MRVLSPTSIEHGGAVGGGGRAVKGGQAQESASYLNLDGQEAVAVGGVAGSTPHAEVAVHQESAADALFVLGEVAKDAVMREEAAERASRRGLVQEAGFLKADHREGGGSADQLFLVGPHAPNVSNKEKVVKHWGPGR